MTGGVASGEGPNFYPPEYYNVQNGRFSPLVEALIRFFRCCRSQFIRRYAQCSTGRILDIGCGRGVMLADLKKKGWDCYGTEQSDIVGDPLYAYNGIKIKTISDIKSCEYSKNFFDCVSLWHVLEHLADPVGTLQEIRRILKPGGILVIEVPNFSSWQSRLGLWRWIYLEVPRHLYHFSMRSLIGLLEKNGFQCLRVSTFSLEFGPFGMIQSLLNLILTQPNFLFLLMKREWKSLNRMTLAQWIINLLLLCIFFFPALLVGFWLELFSVLVKRGGVIRVVAARS